MQEFCLQLIIFKRRNMCKCLFLRAKLPQTSAKLCESLSFSINLKLQCLQQSGLEAINFKLDWASGKSLTTTLSSQAHLMFTRTKFRTLFMGSN